MYKFEKYYNYFLFNINKMFITTETPLFKFCHLRLQELPTLPIRKCISGCRWL